MEIHHLLAYSLKPRVFTCKYFDTVKTLVPSPVKLNYLCFRCDRGSFSVRYFSIAFPIFFYIPFVLILCFSLGIGIKIFVLRKKRNAKKGRLPGNQNCVNRVCSTFIQWRLVYSQLRHSLIFAFYPLSFLFHNEKTFPLSFEIVLLKFHVFCFVIISHTRI